MEWGEEMYSVKVCWHFGTVELQEELVGSGGGVKVNIILFE